MIAALLKLLGDKIAQYGALLLFAAVTLFSVRQSGKKAEQSRSAQQNLKAMEKRHDVEETINRLPDSDVQQRLREKWMRD